MGGRNEALIDRFLRAHLWGTLSKVTGTASKVTNILTESEDAIFMWQVDVACVYILVHTGLR